MIKLVCPECGSKEIRYRRTDWMLWCRHCGHEGKKVEFKSKEDKQSSETELIKIHQVM